MASISYPPWSAPTTLERGEKKSKWKQALLRPWIRRSQKKKDKKKAASPANKPSIEDRYNLNPFAPRASPFHMGGGMPHQFSPFANFTPRATHTDDSSDEQPRQLFDPDALISKPNRPSLSNVFPMYDSPLITPTPPRTRALHERRHSIPATPTVIPPTPMNKAPPQDYTPRRPSQISASSDITSERSNRRQRRADAFRVIPLLPTQQRNVSPSERVYASPYRQPMDPMHYPPYTPNQYKGLQNSFSFPPWPQPHEQLEELEEELKEDEIDGEEAESFVELMESKSREKLKLKQLNAQGQDIRGFDAFMMY